MLGISIATGGIDPDASALKYLKYSPSIENLRNGAHGSIVSALSPKHVGIHFHNTERVFVAEPLHPSIQELRDEVRMMVAEGRPMEPIPHYQGRRVDGDPIAFLNKYYGKYLPSRGWHSLYCHDLLAIDPRLLTAVRDACRGTTLPIKVKREFSDALLAGAFTDGSSTEYKKNYLKKCRISKGLDS